MTTPTLYHKIVHIDDASVICSVTKEGIQMLMSCVDDDVILLRYPLRVNVSPQGYVLYPWVLGTTDEWFPISTWRIVTFCEPSETIMEYYDRFIESTVKDTPKDWRDPRHMN